MVDNFQLINDFITFDSPNEFYFVQIIRRAKDAPYIGSNNQYIKSYNVYSSDDLQNKKSRIIDLCSRLDARAYIHLAPRNDEIIALMMMEELAKLMRERQYPNTRNLWATMCGRYIPPGGRRLWIVDIDGEQYEDVDTILDDIEAVRPEGIKTVATLPTKNGCHLITRPFDLFAFRSIYAGIDVHKNNPTVLFCP